jgi:hypothetical protein
MDGKDLLVVSSLLLLAVSVILAAIGFSQAIVSAFVGAVGTGFGILWKWLEKRELRSPSLSSRSLPAKAAILIDEAPTIRGKGRQDYVLNLAEDQKIQISSNATEGRYSIGIMSQTDYSLQRRSGGYDMEWYYEKKQGKSQSQFPGKKTRDLVPFSLERRELLDTTRRKGDGRNRIVLARTLVGV